MCGACGFLKADVHHWCSLSDVNLRWHAIRFARKWVVAAPAPAPVPEDVFLAEIDEEPTPVAPPVALCDAVRGRFTCVELWWNCGHSVFVLW